MLNLTRTCMPTLSHHRRLAILSLYAALCGCSAVMHPVRKVSHLGGEVSLDVTVAPDANQDTAVAVDILAVTDKKTLKELSALTAQAWFAKRTTFLRMHPTDLRVFSYEWVPGQQVAQVKIPQAGLADGILLFANYVTPGEHTSSLPKSGVVQLELGPKDFKILTGRS